MTVVRTHQLLEQRRAALVGEPVGDNRIVLPDKTEVVTMDDEINVLRETPDETEPLGQRRATLEEKSRMVLGHTAEQGIENQ